MFNSAFDAVVPVICVSLAGLFALLAEAFRAKGEQMPIGGLASSGWSAPAWPRCCSGTATPPASASSPPTTSRCSSTWSWSSIGILTVLFSSQTIERDGLPAGEYYALMLFAIVGMMLMAQATDLLLIFLALEMMSIAVYVLTGLRRDQADATEAAFKYFLLGAFASSFFLYGIALHLRRDRHAPHLERAGAAIAAQSMAGNPMLLLAVGLLLVGFALQGGGGAVPHVAPDAYEGAPPSVTGFMSTGVKAAAFAAFVRVFLSALEPAAWPTGAPVLWAIAAATMVVGTVVGVSQTNVKRMLAYSSIAHGGYLLVALVAANDVGKASLLFYLAAYAVTNVGAFGIIALLGIARARQRRAARLRRAGALAPGAGRADDDLPAVARRLPADGRLHRQVVRVHRRGRAPATTAWRSSAC